MAKYGIAIQTIKIKPDMMDKTSDEISQIFTIGLNQIVQKVHKLVNLKEGGWEIVSHSLTRLDRHLVLSFLTRREG